MVQSLQLGNSNQSAEDKGMKRLNRLPLYFGIGLAVLFLAVLVYGLSSRGLHFGSQNPDEAGSNVPASNFAEQMKRGVTDGIIGDREDQPVYQPTPVTPTKFFVFAISSRMFFGVSSVVRAMASIRIFPAS